MDTFISKGFIPTILQKIAFVLALCVLALCLALDASWERFLIGHGWELCARAKEKAALQKRYIY